MVNERWKGALRRADLPDDRYHMMHVPRHTFVSACLSAGLSVRAVAEFIGDTEATVQATYSHLMPDDRDKARKAKQQFFTRLASQPQGSQAAGMFAKCSLAPRRVPDARSTAGGILATSQATSALPLVPRVPGNPRNRR